MATAAKIKPTEQKSHTKLKERASELGVTFLSSVPKNFNKEDVKLISEEVSRRYNLVTFFKDTATDTLHTAMADPQNLHALNILRFLAQKEKLGIEVYLATEDVIEELQNSYGSAEKAVQSAVQSLEETLKN